MKNPFVRGRGTPEEPEREVVQDFFPRDASEIVAELADSSAHVETPAQVPAISRPPMPGSQVERTPAPDSPYPEKPPVVAPPIDNRCAQPISDADRQSSPATIVVATPAASGQPALEVWVAPGTFRSTLVPTGPYAGLSIVGEPGSLLETVREIAPPITGGHRPAVIVDVVDVGRVTVGAVSLRGALHYDSRVVRQDSYALGTSDDGQWAVVGMADGVSEGPLSHLGADAAAQQSLTSARGELARVGFDAADWNAVAEDVRTKVRSRSRQLIAGKITTADGGTVDAQTLSDEDLARSMGTTAELLIVAVKPSESGVFPYVRIVIAGDGTGLVLDPSRGWKTLSIGKTHAGGFANNAVRPLPIDPGAPLIQRGELEHGQAIFVTTDGIGNFILDGSTQVGGYLHQEWAKPVSAVNLVRSSSFITYQADDDRTAVIVWV